MGSSLNFPSLDLAIQQAEGYYPGSAAYRNNNPGNLVPSSIASQYGGTGGGAGGFAVFPDYNSGQRAQDALVTQYYSSNPDATLSSLLSMWAPSSAPGNSKASLQQYELNVSNILGVPPDTKLSMLQNQPSSSTGATLPTLSGGVGASVGSAVLGATGLTGVTGLIATDGTSTGKTVQENLLGWAQSGFSWSRVGCFLVGLICLVIGLFMLRPVQDVVQNVTEKISKAGTTAAMAA
jgi:hypothetical protein